MAEFQELHNLVPLVIKTYPIFLEVNQTTNQINPTEDSEKAWPITEVLN